MVGCCDPHHIAGVGAATRDKSVATHIGVLHLGETGSTRRHRFSTKSWWLCPASYGVQAKARNQKITPPAADETTSRCSRCYNMCSKSGGVASRNRLRTPENIPYGTNPVRDAITAQNRHQAAGCRRARRANASEQPAASDQARSATCPRSAPSRAAASRCCRNIRPAAGGLHRSPRRARRSSPACRQAGPRTAGWE
jgi:hypothetical protein